MSKGVFKFIVITVIFIIFIYAFSASYSANNIDNIAYVIALGIDVGSEEKTVQVTFEFMDASTFSSDSSSDSSSPIIDTVTSSSINSAINLLNSYVGKEINLSHCKVIIFSEELASKGINSEITELMNNIQIRPTANFIVSKCSATDYIQNSTSSLEKVLTKYYDIFPNSTEYTGYTSNIMIGDFYNNLTNTSSGNLAILGGLNESDVLDISISSIVAGASPIVGERGTENIGLAVFKQDKYIGELTAMDTLCSTIISGEVNSFLFRLDNTEIYKDILEVTLFETTSPKINVDISNDEPTINIDLEFTGRIVGIENQDGSTDLDLEEISNVLSEYLKSYIIEYLNKTTSEFGCDLNGFFNYAKCNFLTTSEWEDYDWMAKYENSRFNVSIKANVAYGLLNAD